jgi:hypothetical protein
LHLSPKVGLERVMIVSPTQGWPRASHGGVSGSRLAFGESCLCLPHGVGLGRVVIASPIGDGIGRVVIASPDPERVVTVSPTQG